MQPPIRGQRHGSHRPWRETRDHQTMYAMYVGLPENPGRRPEGHPYGWSRAADTFLTAPRDANRSTLQQRMDSMTATKPTSTEIVLPWNRTDAVERSVEA